MSRFVLPPRAALLLVGAVLLVAVGVVVLGGGAGAGSAGGDGVAVVSGAPTAVPSVSTASSSALPAPFGSATGSPAPAAAVVHVVGAVAHAGVVRVPAGARVDDAVAAAGGATADADLTRVNLARPVVDGERLYVPTVGETDVPAELPVDGGSGAGAGAGAAAGSAGGGAGGAGAAGPGASAGVGAVVDLNTADATTLETLPGIGPALAQRILAWREEHGGFRSVEDLLEVSGIGDARFAELQDRVRV